MTDGTNEIFTAENFDTLTFLANKAKEEYDAGKMGPLEYLDSLKLIRRLAEENRVEEFMKLHGYVV